ncbi:MAG: tRNA (adenosine(37)-N6)-dimethylallyltransferase MiaA [Clostridia bacterium]|nr:tRNA (adenosine(37)-N6)-dimethylallyltransferase MiaA [Clostridia bacterium]
MNASEKPRILAIVGPTASGKSALALELAKRLGGEVVSCDSMQIYRGMDIGTAKPTAAEQREVPHHLIDIAEPEADFSAMDYVSAAEAAVQDILCRGRLPVFCGGTGLYLDAFLRGGVAETPGADPALRAELNTLAAARGAEYLHTQLRQVDPASADAVHPNNVRRVIRALEIYRATGIPKSEWDRRSLESPTRYRATVLGLSYTDREVLYRRIERRVDLMIEEGLVEETRRLMERGVFEASRTASAAIGYKELLPYCRGECELSHAVAELKTATRRYAKRQMTWFSAKPYVHWIEANDGKETRKSEEIVNMSLELLASLRNMI